MVEKAVLTALRKGVEIFVLALMIGLTTATTIYLLFTRLEAKRKAVEECKKLLAVSPQPRTLQEKIMKKAHPFTFAFLSLYREGKAGPLFFLSPKLSRFTHLASKKGWARYVDKIEQELTKIAELTKKPYALYAVTLSELFPLIGFIAALALGLILFELLIARLTAHPA